MHRFACALSGTRVILLLLARGTAVTYTERRKVWIGGQVNDGVLDNDIDRLGELVIAGSSESKSNAKRGNSSKSIETHIV